MYPRFVFIQRLGTKTQYQTIDRRVLTDTCLNKSIQTLIMTDFAATPSIQKQASSLRLKVSIKVFYASAIQIRILQKIKSRKNHALDL